MKRFILNPSHAALLVFMTLVLSPLAVQAAGDKLIDWQGNNRNILENSGASPDMPVMNGDTLLPDHETQQPRMNDEASQENTDPVRYGWSIGGWLSPQFHTPSTVKTISMSPIRCGGRKFCSRVDGACGAANGTVVSSAPSANLCFTGTASAVSGTGPFDWTCAGVNGGASATCSASLAPPAACGTHASGTTYTLQLSQTSGTTTPTIAQCPYGGTQPTTTTVTQSYSCANGVQTAQGSSVSTTANSGNPTCNAPAACGSTPSGSTVTQTVSTTAGSIAATTAQCPYGGTQPTTTTVTQVKLCTNGTLSNQGNSVSTTVNSGSPSCNAPAACGSTSSGSTVTQTVSMTAGSIAATTSQCPYGGTQPTTTTVKQVKLCTNGTLSNQGSSVSTTVNSGNPTCNVAVNGSCGSSNGASMTMAPTASLCATGAASAVGGAGPWSWSCAGSNGGSTASCSALLEKTPIQIPQITAPPVSANATTYYVSSVSGNDSNNGLSQSTPFAHIATAINNPAFKGGDIIMVMPGTYYETAFLSKSGTPAGYTTLMAMPGQARPVIISSPTIYSAGWGTPQFGNTISIRGNYIRVSGFDVSWEYDTNTPGIYGSAIGTCCSISTVNGVDKPMVHHIFIDNNVVHDSPAGGISIVDSDYFTIIGNVVYGNANQAPNETSGISIYASVDFDTAAGYHTVIANNISYNNRNLVPSNYTLPNGTVENFNCTTDGNGIIIDSNRRQDSDNIPYKSSTLIFGNLVYDNGGRGIELYASDNVTVVNNTSYENVQDPQMCEPSSQSEMAANTASAIYFYNNIAVSAGVAHAISDTNTTDDIWHNNIMYGGSVSLSAMSGLVFDSSNIVGVDPLLVAPSFNPATANFNLQANSPAIGIGAPLTTSQTDIGGVAVQANVPVNLGAYFK